MVVNSTDVPPDYLGARGEGDRRKAERRKRPRLGPERRVRDRRRAALGGILAAAAVTFPYPAKPAPVLTRSLTPAVTTTPAKPAPLDSVLTRPLTPADTTTIDEPVALPPEHAYDEFIREASEQYQVDPTLIRSVMQTESAFDAMAVSRSGAIGLMQLMPDVAEELGVADPFDPRQNVMGGAKYLRRLLDLHRGNVRLALASYNAGVSAVAQYGGVPPFPETQRYVKRITKLVKSARRHDK